MLEFQIPQISAEKVEDNRGNFTIEPLDRGFGYTFGNSLRRVLLSSLAGAAVTSVRIEGVAHEVESARVGQRTDYDKLTLDIETDGSVAPQAALREAAEILIKSLAIFTDADRLEELRSDGDALGVGEPAAAGPRASRSPDGMDDILIEELELGVRSYNCLKRAGVQTVGDLLQKSESELNAIPNFGRKSIEEVIETLKARGLELRAA